MTDRQLLWLISAFPVLLMLGTIFYLRWKKMSGARLRNEVIAVIAVFLAATGPLIWYLLQKESSNTHVFIQDPRIFLLAIPGCILLLWLQLRTLAGISRGRMWFAFLLRSAIVILVALALAGLQMIVERDALTVLFALDVSKSIPESERNKALDYIRKSTKETMKPNDEAGLLVFGGKAALAREATNLFVCPQLKDIKAVIDPNATNIGQAIRNAGASFDESSRRRLVLFTDGRQTTGNAEDELSRLVAQGVDVWIVPLSNGDSAEMLIEKVDVPSELLWEQTFDTNVYVWSNIKTSVNIHLYPGDKAGSAKLTQKVELNPGKNRVTFQGMRMHSGGPKELRAVLEPINPADDTLNENNEGYAFTDVQTESRLLVLTSDLEEVQSLLGALEGEKIELDVRSPASLPANPEDYRAYDCIILANLARGYLSDEHMKVIESCVKDQGAGLIMIGGDQSFGAGGYLHTPIEAALPVDMDLKNERVMPSGALCIVLHTCEFGDGNAWGKKISKAAINTLSPQDYAGLIFFGNLGASQWAFKPMPVSRKQVMFTYIDGCEPGDMPDFEAVVSLAVTELTKLQNVSLKHCIIITDGDPQPPRAATVNAAKAAAITISAVTIQPHGGADIATIKDVCLKTGGRYYTANDPKKLPQIFIKEAAVVRKSLIYADDKGIPIALGAAGTTLKEFGSNFPNTRAVVLTQPKARAELQLYTVKEGEKVPVLMSWHYGLGQSVAFTTDARNRWSPDWVKWQGYKKFWTNIIRGVSRQRMPSNHTVTTRIENGVAHVFVEGVDDKGDYLNFAKLVGNAVAPRGPKGENEGESHVLNFNMTQPGRYEATFPVDRAGAYAITVTDQSNVKSPQSIVTGVANSYSLEFAHTDNDVALLQKMGEIATGKSAVNHLKEFAKLDPKSPALFAHDLPATRQPSDLWKWLLIAALCLFPLDVAVRRLALDPEKAFLWLYGFIEPVLAALSLKKRQLQAAAAQSMAGGNAEATVIQDIVPTGIASREAQSRFEQAGESDAAKSMSLEADANAGKSKPAVGGTKVSQADAAASEYTGALLKAKKRAKKE